MSVDDKANQLNAIVSLGKLTDLIYSKTPHVSDVFLVQGIKWYVLPYNIIVVGLNAYLSWTTEIKSL